MHRSHVRHRVVMTRRGSCVKLNADYTLARVPSIRLCLSSSSSSYSASSFSFTPFSPFAPCCAFPHQRLNRARFSRLPAARQTRATRGGCFTQSVAIIEYLPARLSRAVLTIARRDVIYPQVYTCPDEIPGATSPGLPTVITCRLAVAGQKSTNRHQSRRIRENGSLAR